MQKFLAMRASAGSGKTFNLVIRYVLLLLEGVNPEDILTLTFTNKATNEMKRKIFDLIVNLDSRDDYLREFEKLGLKESLIQNRDKILQTFLNSDIKIMTIDKFLNSILRKFALHSDIGVDFEISNSDREEFIKEKFIENLTESELERVIEFAHYEDKGLDSLFELFYSLYERDKEIERFESTQEFNLKTLEEDILELALQIKSYYESVKALSKAGQSAVNFQNIDQLFERGKTWLTKDSLKDYSYFSKKSIYNPSLEEPFEQLKLKIREYLLKREANALSSLFEIYEHFKRYRFEYKRLKSELTFSDILNIVYSLLSNIDNQFLYFRLDSQISHILIDEFQDTSVVQFKIFEPLIEEMRSTQSDRSFFYVGDIKQSIYRFRGGKRELFDYLIEQYNFEIQSLNRNFRSRKEIVNFVNSTFKDIMQNYDIQYPNSQKDGFVKVIESKEKIEADVISTLKELLKKGANPDSITLLTFTNQDILNLKEIIESSDLDINIVTETSSKLINQSSVRAIINLIKYIYFQERIYLANFLSLIGRRVDERVDTDRYSIFQSPSELIYQLSNEFNIFDDNLLKFIELSFNYPNMTEFVYEIDFLEESMVSHSGDGVKIMTIHKSKGLEFENLILVDKFADRESSNYSPLIYDYRGIDLEKIRYKFNTNINKIRKSLDIDFSKSLEREEREGKIDDLNALYVGVTRAKNSLFIIKKSKKSKFNLLNLSELERGYLEIDRFQSREVKVDKIELNLKRYGTQEDIVNSGEDEHNEYDIRAKYFGIATHYMLENLEEFNLENLRVAKQKTNNRFGIYFQNEIEVIERRVEKLILNRDFLNLIDGEIEREAPLIFNSKKQIIDLLIKRDNLVNIIDYKTLNEDELSSEYLEKYKKQLNRYRDAVSKIYPSKEINCYLALLKRDKSEIVKL